MTTTKERHNFPEEGSDFRSPRDVTMVWPPIESAQTQSPVEPEPALPGSLSRTMLVLLPRDPKTLYAFWSIRPETSAQISASFGPNIWQEARKILRVYRLAPMIAFFDLEVGEASTWYLNDLQADCPYRAELGLLTLDGQFILIAKSNQTRTPRDRFSEDTDEEWMTLAELYGLSVGLKELRGSEEVLGRVQQELAQAMGSEAVSSISSPWGGAFEPQPTEVELEVETYIILQGRTKPRAQVTINDQSVTLDATGKFIFSAPLVDGELPLTIKARWPQGEQRSQTLNISRWTR